MGARNQCRLDPPADIGVAGRCVREDNIGIAHVRKAHALKVGDVILMLIGRRVAETEQGRRLTHTAWAKSRVGTPLCARIAWRAKIGGFGVQRGSVRLIGRAAKVQMPVEGRFRRPPSYPWPWVNARTSS